jgi:hypothetical protein
MENLQILLYLFLGHASVIVKATKANQIHSPWRFRISILKIEWKKLEVDFSLLKWLQKSR